MVRSGPEPLSKSSVERAASSPFACSSSGGSGDDDDDGYNLRGGGGGGSGGRRIAHPTEGDALIHVGGGGGGGGGSSSRNHHALTGKKGKKASWNDIVASVAILSVAGVLVVYSWTMHRHTQGIDWNPAPPSAYPFKPLKLDIYDTADVIDTARSGRWFRGAQDAATREQYEAQPDSWLADPTDMTVFAWEGGVFSLNFLHATSEELGGIQATPKVSARMLEMWRRHDYDALAELGG